MITTSMDDGSPGWTADEPATVFGNYFSIAIAPDDGTVYEGGSIDYQAVITAYATT